MLRNMVTFLNAYLEDKKGQTMVEYGLIVAFIAIIVLVGVALVGNDLNNFFTNLADNF